MVVSLTSREIPPFGGDESRGANLYPKRSDRRSRVSIDSPDRLDEFRDHVFLFTSPFPKRSRFYAELPGFRPFFQSGHHFSPRDVIYWVSEFVNFVQRPSNWACACCSSASAPSYVVWSSPKHSSSVRFEKLPIFSLGDVLLRLEIQPQKTGYRFSEFQNLFFCQDDQKRSMLIFPGFLVWG